MFSFKKKFLAFLLVLFGIIFIPYVWRCFIIVKLFVTPATTRQFNTASLYTLRRASVFWTVLNISLVYYNNDIDTARFIFVVMFTLSC